MFHHRFFVVAILAFVSLAVSCQEVGSLPATALAANDEPAKEETVGQTAEVRVPDTVVVYYFHTDFRCRTCTTMQRLADETIKGHFAEELASGKIQWRVVNTDREENKHFTQDYQLYTKSLIVTALKDGRQIGWKNCEKIWQHVRDPEAFKKYVTAEIRAYLEGV